MTNAEQYWIWQQEQPTDVLIVGNQKRIKPVTVVYADIPEVKRSVEELERAEDEFLKQYGV